MDGIVAFIVGTLIGVAIHSYIKKRIKELDEHPELNKNGKISQKQAEKYFKYFVVFLLLATFIILAIHVSLYGGALIFPPLM